MEDRHTLLGSRVELDTNMPQKYPRSACSCRHRPRVGASSPAFFGGGLLAAVDEALRRAPVLGGNARLGCAPVLCMRFPSQGNP